MSFNACRQNASQKRERYRTPRLYLRILPLLFLTTWLTALGGVNAQAVTLSEENVNLEKVFKLIKQQTGYTFVYREALLRKAKKVTVSLQNGTVEQALDICFRGQPLSYTIINQMVVIEEKKEQPVKQTAIVDEKEVPVRGKVVNEKGEPLDGASITEKGTSNSTMASADGSFAFNVSKPGVTLVISFVGYEIKEVISSAEPVSVVMNRSEGNMTDIVVVGYGTQRRKDVTGSIASIPKERLQQVPNTNIAEALQGAVPGIQVNMNAGGAEGSSVSMLVRGRSSISAGTGPLIIWDGVPFVGGISEININDVESIDILKDASAAAIYGSRGANGVILITSKSGKKGIVSINYDGYYGNQMLTNKPDLLNGEEFYQFKTTRLNTGNLISPQEQEVYDTKTWVDWYDLATRTGSKSQHTLSASGGSEKLKFYFGASSLNVQGVSLGDMFKRYSLRPSLTINVTSWLTLSSSSQLSFQDRSGQSVEFDDSRNTGGGANFFNPLTRPYNDDGSLALYAYADYSQSRNPLASLLVRNEALSYRIFSTNNLKVDIPFIKGLSYQLNTGVEYENSGFKTYYGRDVARGYEVNGEAINYNSNALNTTLENIVNYTRGWGDHRVNLTLLYSSQDINFDSEELTGVGFPNDVLTNFQMTNAVKLTHAAQNYEQKLVSQMARLNYSFLGKYLLTLTGRRDGYSGFGADTKYGVFPTAAIGWNLSQESFMQGAEWINNLKLRASYGLNGNQAVSAYQSLATLGNASYISGTTVYPGYTPNRLANERLGWESKKALGIGLDFSILNNRISGTIDYYNARTKNLLLQRNISPVQGFSSILQNIGKTANEGVDIGLNSTNITGSDFSWSTTAVFSYNKNKIIDLYGDGKDDVGNNWFIGKPIRVAYGLQYDGIFRSEQEVASSAQPTAKPGWVRVKDADGDKTINTASDRVLQGNLDPSFVFGLTNTFRYKGISLMIFMNGVADVVKVNPLQNDDVFSDTKRNTTRKDWWSPSNPNGTHFANDDDANQFKVAFIENAGFVRLRDVSLAYEFPRTLLNRLKISSLKIYGTARNFATITGYKGLDPELTNQYGLPLQKELIFGLTIGL